MSQQQLSTQEWLDQYEVLDVIGNGMFGVIRKVRSKRTGEVLARKDLNFEKMSDKDRKQIVAEVNILKDLNHPNIVRYVDRHVDRENGFLYILMEYCAGGDLGRVLTKARKQSRPLGEHVIWQYFHQLLQALDHCHNPNSQSTEDTNGLPRRTQQVLHRDIKPENIFISDDGTLKLGDFGLSKQMGGATMASTYVGTPYYMSPEMLGEKAYDAKSDIWSLGCVVYELCALQPPFYAAKTQQDLTAMIRSGRIPSLHGTYSSGLFSVIKSMLNLNPASRPSVQYLLAHKEIQTASKNDEAQRLLDEIKREKEVLAVRTKQVEFAERQLATARAQLEHDQATLKDAYETLQKNRMQTLADFQREREKLNEEKMQFDADRARFTAELDAETRAYAQNKQYMDQTALEFSKKYAAFEKEKADFEKEREQWRAERQAGLRVAKKPFEDIQNQKNTIPLPGRYLGIEDSPSRVVQPLPRKLPVQDQNVPPASSSAPPAIPADRQATPKKRRSAARLASKSNPNLGSAMKGVIMTASGIQVETPMIGSTHDIPPVPPVPAVPALTEFLTAASRMSMDSPENVRKVVAATSDNDALGIRHRRRSTISGPSRPPVQPTTRSATTFDPSTLGPAPVYDLNDEENLPSPFIKKGLGTSGTSLKLGFKKQGSLLSLATANSATASSKTSISTAAAKPSSRSSLAVRASAEAQNLKALLRRANGR